MSSHNEKRKASFARKSSPDLVRFVKAGSLSAACALYHLKARGDLHLLATKGN